MTLKVDFRLFLDEIGNVTDLTKQAKTVFNFLSKIVLSVSADISKPKTNVDLKCNTRSDELTCEGFIDGTYNQTGVIEWNCDTCEASGTISNWQGSTSDKQRPTLH